MVVPIALSVPNAVRYSGVSRTRIYALMRSGELSSFLLGGRRMMLTESIDAFIHKLARSQA
jgi:predicted DNA-binding transcriptional regulator AlpA